MACKVTITSVTATGPPLTAVDVTGTATVPDCTTVEVILECGGEPGPKLTGVPVDAAGNWVAHFTGASLKGTPCACGRSYTVTAVCEQSPQCEKGVAQGEFECKGPCPTAAISVTVGDCTPDGYRNVTFDTTITPGTDPTIVTQWDYGDSHDDTNVHTTTLSQYTWNPTHAYAPGQQYTAILKVLLPTGCANLATVTIGPLAACPCPDLHLSPPSVSGCADPAQHATATATFTATLTPPGVNCGPYHWSFGDGTNDVTTTPTTTHSYSTPGSFSVAVSVTCGACQMTQGTTVVIPQCPGGGNGPGGGGEGFGCFGARVIMTVAAILAIVSAALALCVPPPAAAVLAWMAVSLGAVAAIAAIFWGILCPKPCAWALLLAWQVSIGVGFVLLYFTTCCPQLLFVGLPLIASGIALMFAWKRRCNMSTCAVLKELSIALSSVILPLLGWLGAIPGLAACINHVVAGILSTLAAAVGVAALHCVGPSQTTGGSTQQGPPLQDLRHPGSQI
jgi:PKD domain-containing protein